MVDPPVQNDYLIKEIIFFFLVKFDVSKTNFNNMINPAMIIIHVLKISLCTFGHCGQVCTIFFFDAFTNQKKKN